MFPSDDLKHKGEGKKKKRKNAKFIIDKQKRLVLYDFLVIYF